MTAVTTDVLVIGAGVYGLSSAWWMTRLRSGARIMVVDEGEFASGASGRNGAGFRMQWGLDLNILLSKESTAFFENAAELLDYPRGIELKQDGYLVLAHSQNALDRLNASIAIQHRYQVPSELLDADACMKMVPSLGRNRLVGGTYCAKDGSASPFRLLDALLIASRREGVDVRYGTRVERIEKRNGVFIASIKDETIEGEPECGLESESRRAAGDELAQGGYRHCALHAPGKAHPDLARAPYLRQPACARLDHLRRFTCA